MIDYVYTDEQLAHETEIIERFHRMRKWNTSRRERQEAWWAAEAIRLQRRSRAHFARPLSPSAEFGSYESANQGWLYPGFRTLEADEVIKYFPGAWQSFLKFYSELIGARLVNVHGRLRISRLIRAADNDRLRNLVWLPGVGVWRRYTREVKVKPFRTLGDDE